MKWYADYLSIYDKPFTQAPQAVINQVKDKIRQLATHAPLVSVVAIAHNEEKRILSCLWSLCENQHNYPVEILVINNHSTDHTEEVLKELGVTYFNEYQKGPGFARQCGLNHARGKYHLCIDADTLYPPQYISTMIKVLQDKEVAGAYALWSFLPNEHHLGLFFYETLRDLYLKIQNLNRPELNVRGMAFAFHTETARKEGFRTDILRGEDGSLALALKNTEIKIRHRPQSPCPYRLWHYFGRRIPVQQFQKRAIKGLRSFTTLFYSKNNYEDEDSNLIK